MKYIKTILIGLVLLPLMGCVPPLTAEQKAEQKLQQQSANRLMACKAGNDCQEKWSRVVQWVTRNSTFKIQTLSDNLIQTYGPWDDGNWSFTITKVARGHNKYIIQFGSVCGSAYGCSPSELSLEADLADYVMGPLSEGYKNSHRVSTGEWSQKVADDMKEVTTACRDKYHSKELKNYLAFVKCSNPPIKALYKRAGCPYNDLVKLFLDKRVEYAKMIDTNQITEDEYSARIEKVLEQMHEEGETRDLKNY